MDKCIGCGACAEKCPKKVIDSYNMGLSKRKAAYVEYAQAVPLKYAIRGDACIKLTKNKVRQLRKTLPYRGDQLRRQARGGHPQGGLRDSRAGFFPI